MSGQPPVQRRNGGRLLAHIAVVIGIAAVAAAAFTLSYKAVRDIALAAGVPATLARLYPAIFDAVFVVACAAALTLREARWWARGYGWLSVLVTGALIGAAAVYHAMGLHLPHKIAAGIVAALPLALVVLGFSLWLSMLRHGRAERTAAADRPVLGQAGPSQTLAIEAGRAVTAEPVSAALPALPVPGRHPSAVTENAPAAERASSPAPGPARTPEPATASGAALKPEPEPEPAPDALTPPYGFRVVAAPSPAEDTSGAPAPEPERTTETGESQVLADTMAEAAGGTSCRPERGAG